MDITSISSSNNQYMSLFKPQSAMNKAQSQFSSNNLTNNLSANAKKVAATNTNKGSAASNIILAKKGQAGYMKEMDSDNDGQVSLEEFNKYCEENEIEGKSKLMLMTSMQVAKSTAELVEEVEAKKAEKSENDTKSDDEKIYAQKGDEKYTNAMDANSNGVITYEEYLDYINAKEGSDSSQESSNTDAQKSDTSDTSTYNEDAKIDKESQSTVEYEV